MNIPLNLSPQEVELVLQALGELPLKISANVYFNIRKQRDDHIKAASETAEKGD